MHGTFTNNNNNTKRIAIIRRDKIIAELDSHGTTEKLPNVILIMNF